MLFTCIGYVDMFWSFKTIFKNVQQKDIFDAIVTFRIHVLYSVSQGVKTFFSFTKLQVEIKKSFHILVNMEENGLTGLKKWVSYSEC